MDDRETMDDPYDTYPEDSDRRRFVKGVVGAGALSGVIGATSSMVDLTTTAAGAGGGPTNYMGIELTAGPAPRGMPQIPLELDDDGYVRGIWPDVETVEVEGQEIEVAEMELGGRTYNTNWFQFCGSQNHTSVQPGENLENYLRYSQDTPYDWQEQEVSPGDRVHVDDFDDYESWGNVIGEDGVGKPALVTWRSDGLAGDERPLPVQLIRSQLVEEQADYENPEEDWLGASTAAGFVAVHNQCTHFCCVPGFKNPGQPDAAAYDAEDLIYCQCHQSVYDPFSIVEQSMVALPRQD